jgi:hypothetical protein
MYGCLVYGCLVIGRAVFRCTVASSAIRLALTGSLRLA